MLKRFSICCVGVVLVVLTGGPSLALPKGKGMSFRQLTQRIAPARTPTEPGTLATARGFQPKWSSSALRRDRSRQIDPQRLAQTTRRADLTVRRGMRSMLPQARYAAQRLALALRTERRLGISAPRINWRSANQSLALAN